MAPRRTAAAKQRLQFSQRLTKDSKLTTAELIKRLQALHVELEKLDQDHTDTESLSAVRKELIAPGLLVHKDKGVKALVACCLADMLRLYAPDAPYTEAELKDIFQFFFRQLKNFSAAKGSNAHQTEYFYLIESLANVQSIVLITDLSGSDELMTDAFRTFFDVVSTEMTKNIPITFADLLSQIIGQASSIPSDVLDALLAQFHPSQAKRNPAAYRLAADVANACADRLQRDVCKYFSETLLAGATAFGAAGDDEDDEDDPDKTDMEDVKSAHALIKSLHKAAPAVLLNVIPQLEEELQSASLELRMLATKTLADMISAASSAASSALAMHGASAAGIGAASTSGASINGPGDIPSRYPSTWKAWLGRTKDKSPLIRIAVVEALPGIWSSRPYLTATLGEVIRQRLQDPDDKVRAAACRAVGELDFEIALHHVEESVFRAIGDRCTDRKAAVQEEALKVLGKLYRLAYSEIEDDDAPATIQFGWIPSTVLLAARSQDPRLLAAVERCLNEYILPLPKTVAEEVGWGERILMVAKRLDTAALRILIQQSRVTDKRPSPFGAYIEACQKNNGGTIDENAKEIKERLASIIKALADTFPDSQKAADDFRKFAGMNDQRIYKLLKSLADPSTDFKTLIKNYQEVQRRFEQASSTIVHTFTLFIYRSSYLLLNQSSIPFLVQQLQKSADDDTTATRSARAMLTAIAKGCPEMIRPHAGDLVKLLAIESNEPLTEASLLALSELARADADAIPADKRVIERASHFATAGNPLQAKYAATILAVGDSRKKSCTAVFKRLVDGLSVDHPARLVASLSALNRIVKHTPSTFDTRSSEVIAMGIKLLTTPSDEGEEEWLDDVNISDLTKARVLALKIMTNRCVAYADLDQAEEVAAPIFKVLWQILETKDTVGGVQHSAAAASRLRLRATHSVLKLARFSKFEKEVLKGEHFRSLTWMAQDQCFQVREQFILKLTRHLGSGKLTSPMFNIISFMVAHDPEPEVLALARRSIAARWRAMGDRMRTISFELMLVRVVHTLAHHPDLSTDPKDVIDFAKYIEFYVDCVATQANVPLLYHLAGKLKTVRDAESGPFSHHLYILSELAQHIIKVRSNAHGWSLSSYPGTIKMPLDIFRVLSNQEDAAKVQKKTFLAENVIEDLKSKVPKKERVAKAELLPRKKKEKSDTTPKKRKTPVKKETSDKKKKKTAKRPRKDWEADEGDVIRAGDETSSEDEEDDDGEPVIKSKPTGKENESKPIGTKSRPRAKPSAGAVAASNARGGGDAMELD